MDGISKSVNGLIKVGIGVFVIMLILTLNYSGYSQTRGTIMKASWACSYVTTNTQWPTGTCEAANVISGAPANYTTYASGVNNTFGSNIQLAIFAVIFAAIILAVVSSLKEAGIGGADKSGGFL